MEKTWRPWRNLAILHSSLIIELAHSRLAFCDSLFKTMSELLGGCRRPQNDGAVGSNVNAWVRHCILRVDVFGRGQREESGFRLPS